MPQHVAFIFMVEVAATPLGIPLLCQDGGWGEYQLASSHVGQETTFYSLVFVAVIVPL